MIRYFIFILLLFSPIMGICQMEGSEKLSIEFGTAPGAGRWIYNKGTTDASMPNNLGWDRTPHDFIMDFSIAALYHTRKLNLGIGLTHSLLHEDEMLTSRDVWFRKIRYKISNGWLNLSQYQLIGEFKLLAVNNFEFNPSIKYGFFSMQTDHPESANFGRSTTWEIGINTIFKAKKIHFFLRPKYTVLTIKPREAKNLNEEHKLFFIQLATGLRLTIK